MDKWFQATCCQSVLKNGKKKFFSRFHIDTDKEIVIMLTKKMKPITKYKISFKDLLKDNLQKKEYHHGHCKNFKR